ncbi:MAG: hypothetical protein GTO40_20195 [Deltaproteobacteria bacterium]|nr:hypothetical protein [Deltaproteobacteria bacterium]
MISDPPEMFECIERADDSIFMKPESPIRAAIIGPPDSVNFSLPFLGCHGFGRKEWMMIGDALDNLVGIHGLAVIEGGAKLYRRLNPLQNIHVVGHGDPASGLILKVIIPTCPCQTPFRQDPLVGMQDRLILLIRNGTQNLLFHREWITQKPKSLIAVSGDKNLVK